MDNLKRLAYPQPIAFCEGNETAQTSWGVHEDFSGFTKLELASLMIAQSISGKFGGAHAKHIAEESVAIAKAVLEEANK